MMTTHQLMIEKAQGDKNGMLNPSTHAQLDAARVRASLRTAHKWQTGHPSPGSKVSDSSPKSKSHRG
jgi:hypothetical protein